MSFEILPFEIKTHIFSFLDDATVGSCSQVSRQWRELAQSKALPEFVETLKGLQERPNFTIAPYSASAFQEKISNFSVGKKEDVVEKPHEVMKILFEEFSKTSLGHKMEHLQGTRARILATLDVPAALRGYYKRSLLEFLKKFDQRTLSICGTPTTKINRLFVSTLGEAMQSNKTTSLCMTSCGLSDEDIEKIKKPFKDLVFLNISQNPLSISYKTNLQKALGERIQTLVL